MIIKEGRYFFSNISKFMNVKFIYHNDDCIVLVDNVLHVNPKEMVKLIENGALLEDSELLRLLYS